MTSDLVNRLLAPPISARTGAEAAEALVELDRLRAALRSEADKKLAADWYTWGFQAGVEAEKKTAERRTTALPSQESS